MHPFMFHDIQIKNPGSWFIVSESVRLRKEANLLNPIQIQCSKMPLFILTRIDRQNPFCKECYNGNHRVKLKSFCSLILYWACLIFLDFLFVLDRPNTPLPSPPSIPNLIMAVSVLVFFLGGLQPLIRTSRNMFLRVSLLSLTCLM